eukprot:35361-Rhodomonas_salina.1
MIFLTFCVSAQERGCRNESKRRKAGSSSPLVCHLCRAGTCRACSGPNCPRSKRTLQTSIAASWRAGCKRPRGVLAGLQGQWSVTSVLLSARAAAAGTDKHLSCTCTDQHERDAGPASQQAPHARCVSAGLP